MGKGRLTVGVLVLAALAIALAVACTKEVVKEVPVEKQVIVEKEVVKIERVEVPVETIVEVEREVVKEVEVEVPVIVEKEVVREVEVPVQVIVEKEVIVEVEVPGETVIVEKEVVRVVEVEKITTVIQEAEVMIKVEYPVPGSVLVKAVLDVGPAVYHRPAATAPYYNFPLLFSIGETLMDYDGANYTPMLADSWAFEELEGEDGITWHIRRGVPWHDTAYGTMDAADVHWTYDESNREGTLPPHAQYWTRDFKNMRLLDSHTNRWDWNNGPTIAWPFLTRHLEHGEWIMSQDHFEDKGEEAVLQHNIGTGPYMLMSHAADDIVTLEAVKNHWRRTPAFETVKLLEVPEETTRIAMLETGQADVIDLALPAAQQIKDTPGITLRYGIAPLWKSGASIHFGGNWTIMEDEAGNAGNTPLALDLPYVGDPDDSEDFAKAAKVRLAMDLAIDRELINEAILGGQGCLGFVYGIDNCNANWDPQFEHDYDPEQAKALMVEAGYPDGFEFTYWNPTNTSDTNVEVCEAIAAMWEKDLGVTVNRDTSAYQIHRPQFINLRSMEMVWCFGIGDTGDPGNYLDLVPDMTYGRVLSNLGYDFPEAFDFTDRIAAQFDPAAAWAGPIHDYWEFMSYKGDTHYAFGVMGWQNPVAVGPKIGDWDMDIQGWDLEWAEPAN